MRNVFDVSYVLQKKPSIDIEFLKHQTFIGEVGNTESHGRTYYGMYFSNLKKKKKIDVILQYKDVAIEVKTADKGVVSCQMVEVLP